MQLSYLFVKPGGGLGSRLGKTLSKRFDILVHHNVLGEHAHLER